MADDSSGTHSLVSVLSEFKNVFDQPETYLKPPASLQQKTLSAIKQIFDFCKKDELSGTRSLASTCPLQELLVENFDDEQIWQEIELQNTPLLRVLKQDVHSLKENVDQLSLLSGSSKVVRGSRLQRSDDVVSQCVSENDNGFVKNASESDTESDRVNEGFNDDENSNDLLDDGDGDDSQDEENKNDDDNNDSSKVKSSTNNNRKQKSTKKKSQVDDSFFKLSDMLQFLDKEDRRYERAHRKKSQKEKDEDDDDDDDDDDEIGNEPVDYFIDMDSDDSEEEEDEEWNKALGVTESLSERKRELTKKRKRSIKSARKMKYADFFDPPDGELCADLGSEAESEEDNEKESDEQEEFDKDAEKEVEDGHVSANREVEDDSDNEEKSKAISNFEKKQQKLKEKIEKLEKANLAQKPWQMSGEAGGNIRPVNSLLEEDVSFDHTTTTAPDITEETTQNLEDLVKQRIKDEAWDDVERKVKPVMEPFEYKKKLPLDQEKSKLSLSQIYEQEYLKQTQAEAEEKENEQHVEIKSLMTKLFTRLDALSNFHFTPKPLKPELKVVSNVPVMSVEEVAPVTVSDAMMLAPEEIHEKKKVQKGSTEKTEIDRKHERREKKRRQHERAVAREKRRKLVEKLNPGLGNKHSKKAALMKLEKDVKSLKNVSLLKDEGSYKPVKSSSAFFSRLQDEVRDQVKAKKETKRMKDKSTVKVSQLKL